jgi:hypothetical protein
VEMGEEWRMLWQGYSWAALVRRCLLRVNCEDYSFFFDSRTALTRDGRTRSCTFGQNWYRTSTPCPKLFRGLRLVGLAEVQARSRSQRRREFHSHRVQSNFSSVG